jgi:general secretion pathway protein E
MFGNVKEAWLRHLGEVGVHPANAADDVLGVERLRHLCGVRTLPANAAEHDLERYARTLTPSIRDDGRTKIISGETTIEEVLRVTRED